MAPDPSCHQGYETASVPISSHLESPAPGLGKNMAKSTPEPHFAFEPYSPPAPCPQLQGKHEQYAHFIAEVMGSRAHMSS